MNPNLTKRAICSKFGISPQAHYQMLQRQALRLLREALVLTRVLEIRRELPRVGTRKLHYLLQPFYQEHGFSFGRDLLAGLLRRHDLLVRTRRKPTRTTFPGGVRSENLLVSTPISAPNQAWVADITYIETDEGFRYLALITDLYSRRIMGWDLSDSLSLEGAVRAMEMAIAAAGGDVKGLIHHSDHGSQYTSRNYLALLHQAQVRSSMGAVGNAYDNAVAERVNGILKLEFLLDQRFPDALSAHQAVANTIRLYNSKRPHLSLAYATPEEVYTEGLRRKNAQSAIANPSPKQTEITRDEGGVSPRLAQPLTA